MLRCNVRFGDTVAIQSGHSFSAFVEAIRASPVGSETGSALSGASVSANEGSHNSEVG